MARLTRSWGVSWGRSSLGEASMSAVVGSVAASAPAGVSLSFSNGDTLHLLLTLSVLLIAVHSLGFLFVKLRQPRVAGEIIAGLALGPTLLGLLSPDLSHQLIT